ncbi:MAG TPA: hypothetical protein PLT22_03100 [Flexilinea sp.]|nr:MAG: hypothetical protein BWY58_01385 [Chloroflexi bacterium ADurb.Bin344]HPL57154.1 hypothetical protein [Flexilinea sp.]
MVEIRKVDTADKKQTGQFVQFHYDLYKGDPNWVPPFRSDIYMMMNRKKHPFYEHSDAEFFTAWKDGKMVGRIAGLNNNSYNNFHHLKTVNFFLYDSIDDQEVCNALFDAVAEWGRGKGEDTLVGSKGFSLYDGYGILVEGYEYRQMMNMSSYNYPYYKTLLENYGFEKMNDFVSMNFTLPDFNLPEKVYKAAEIAKKRGYLHVYTFKNKKEIMGSALKIAQAYAKSFENNWEYFPLSEREFLSLVDNVIKVVDPKMVKFIYNDKEELVGFLLGFPDISAAMQRHNGNLNPALILDLLREMKKTKYLSLNGMGILEEYRKKGGNALLYTAILDLLKEHPNIYGMEATQMAESAKEIQVEMLTMGLKPTKRHRVFSKSI